MKKPHFFLVCLMAAAVFAASVTTAHAQDTMTNDEVISLAKAGLNPTLIVGKIRTSKSDFDMSTDALIKLKQAAGVSGMKIVSSYARRQQGEIKIHASAPVNSHSGPQAKQPASSRRPERSDGKAQLRHLSLTNLGKRRRTPAKMTPTQGTNKCRPKIATGAMFTSPFVNPMGSVKLKNPKRICQGRNAGLPLQRGTTVPQVLSFYSRYHKRRPLTPTKRRPIRSAGIHARSL